MDRVLIYSFQQESGKSTLALQLAHFYNQKGHKMVLMDYTINQTALESLGDECWQPSGSDMLVRGVAARQSGGMLSRVWAEQVSDAEMVVVDTSVKLEQSSLDYLLRQVNSILLLVDVRDVDLELFGQQFSELIKRIRMVRSRLVVVATHCDRHDLLRVVQLRQELDQFQIPLAMKLESAATSLQVESLAQMLLNDEMRVDSVSGNRLGRALHPAMKRAASMVSAVETLPAIVDEVKGDVLLKEEIEQEVSSPLSSLREKNQRLLTENERLRRS
ncbi:MAG: hypothetical protein HON68_09475 [Gammaproteobacteria bacterium]|nr:hypothetical protein [Gammaproteobacteria bacterium]MBT3488313.1 hypothetical protein [Gammaproteobacteria bacterium]MBT3718413.1 hypothetical protein [Gammaproteobacteria bacterium]MBT3844852.1 hypothetical protein [Gammaproteobacteria bacterium]MBT3894356.1 hypothetical protein [Gammaproteobacteria bacterium]